VGAAQLNQVRSGWLVGLIALAGGLAAPVSTPVAGPLAAPRPAVEFASPLGAELAERLSKPGADPELAGFYQARRHRALWVRGGRIAPEARRLIAILQASGADNLDPARYGPDHLSALVRAAASGRVADLARAELALSGALADWGSDLRRPRPSAALLYSDPELRPPEISRRQVLETVAAAPALGAGLDRAAQMNPIYRRLRQLLAQGKPSQTADAARIRANLERARALPVDLGRRFILVDVPAQRLWMYENGRPVDGMKVVVGKPAEPTPGIAALVRYAVFRPYWNVPADLVAKNMAPKILAGGLGYFHKERLEALSDWGADAAPLDPAKVDWPAVASGRTVLRVRQLPGPANMMGQMKFIFPNELGVYLHDSPLRALFVGDERLGSAGCVRLEDAARLGRWLLGDAVVAKGLQPGPPETRVDLPEPTPVYITYFTVAPTEGGVSVRRDIYGRDAALIADLAPAAGSRRALR
jgi:murein L,D-transpeptidase YcbB/YkuD